MELEMKRPKERPLATLLQRLQCWILKGKVLNGLHTMEGLASNNMATRSFGEFVTCLFLFQSSLAILLSFFKDIDP